MVGSSIKRTERSKLHAVSAGEGGKGQDDGVRLLARGTRSGPSG